MGKDEAKKSEGRGSNYDSGRDDTVSQNRSLTFEFPAVRLVDDAGMPLSLHLVEVEVKVDGETWKQVPSLEHSGPTDRHYTIEVDAEGNSYVRFGDGNTGARLPSGCSNVVASYRAGLAAAGNVVGTRTAKARRDGDYAMALMEIMARIGDLLAQYQDMVAQEAYLASARKRGSLREHARKLDYQLHAGVSTVNRLLMQLENKTTVTSNRKVTKRSKEKCNKKQRSERKTSSTRS